MQLWVAQPEATRHGPSRFQHAAHLPVVEQPAASVTVLAGTFEGATSPAEYDSALVGLDAVLRPGTTAWPLRPDFEHVVVVMSGEVDVEGAVARPGQLADLGRGRDEVALRVREPARIMLLGGAPFGSEVLMWWNFVARTREEIDAAFVSWRDEDGRFGDTGSSLARIPTGPPVWWPPAT
jgi:redox-sensitive bicupin YhaK (pirin superfamily)